ncbi:hypothetical protein N7537_011608 [Penicillium hordei]|uniref:Uncharacterized protein n=1 Tax=Penicillium hordei TaxID=40994 RepID=A0AAD6GU81_9EURO|nr:uncharacterized protein N7537_011608 [Penicillium hordei]KAJ5588930.1 hypothetical protein N7537_011608 [Penicillium hordei]
MTREVKLENPGQWCLRPTFLEGKTSCQKGANVGNILQRLSIEGILYTSDQTTIFRISPSYCTTVIDVILSVCARLEKKRAAKKSHPPTPRAPYRISFDY